MTLPHDARSPVNPDAPEPPGYCDRCGRKWFRKDLHWAMDWRGNQLTNLRILVCFECQDRPFEFNRPIILPADPEPVVDPRPGFQTQQEGPPPPVQSVQSITHQD